MVWLWSKTAATNATADPSINFREGQSPGSLNDSMRALMARVADFRDDISGPLQTAGTSTAYTLTTNQNFNTSGSATPQDGQTVAFRPHVTNGAGPILFNVDAMGNKPLRMVSGTEIPSGFLIAGTPYRATYFAATGEWIVHYGFGNPYNIPIGGSMDYFGSSPPNSNFVFPYGQAISRTSYAALFALMGTTWGVGDGSSTFNLPDCRGRVTAGLDNMGGSAAGRITSGGSGINGAALGQAGGAETVTLAQSALPNVAPTFSGTPVPDHSHPPGNNDSGGTQYLYGFGLGSDSQGWTGGSFYGHIASSSNTGPAGGHTPSGSISSINGGVAQTAVNKMPPVIICTKILRVI